MQSDFPETHWLDFQGSKLAWYAFEPDSAGGPAQAPLLWLHANGYAALTYTPLLRALAASGRRVYALDFVGHGNSEPRLDFQDWFFFRDQALALVERLAEPELHIVGHSVGGATTLLTAAALQKRGTESRLSPATRVRSLSLLDPTVLSPLTAWLVKFLPNNMARAAEARRSEFNSLKVVARSYRMHPGFRDWRQDVFDAYLRSALRARREDNKYELRLPPSVEARIFRTLGPGQWKHHRQVKAPLQVIQATPSPVCPDRSARRLAAQNPESRALRHPEGSHFFPMEFPDWTVERILEFIAKH